MEGKRAKWRRPSPSQATQEGGGLELKMDERLLHPPFPKRPPKGGPEDYKRGAARDYRESTRSHGSHLITLFGRTPNLCLLGEPLPVHPGALP